MRRGNKKYTKRSGHFLFPKISLSAGNLAAKWIHTAKENQFDRVSNNRLTEIYAGCNNIRDEDKVAAMDVENPQSIRKNSVACTESGARKRASVARTKKKLINNSLGQTVKKTP